MVVTLLDMEDGTTRLIIDDVVGDSPTRDTSWKHEHFFTHRTFGSKEINDMALPDAEYQEIGENVILRLLALNDRVR